jgi:hypothetical protein
MHILHSRFNLVSSVVVVAAVWAIVVVRCTRDDGCADPSTLSNMLVWGWLDTFSAMLLTVALLANLVVVYMAFTPAEAARGLPWLIIRTHALGWLGAFFVALFTLKYDKTLHLISATVMFVGLNIEVWLVVAFRRGRRWHGVQVVYATVTTLTMLAFLIGGAGWFEIANISMLVLASNWLSIDHREILEFHTEEVGGCAETKERTATALTMKSLGLGLGLGL